LVLIITQPGQGKDGWRMEVCGMPGRIFFFFSPAE